MVACLNASMCTSGQICCATGMMGTACETGSCPMVFGMQIQLCASATECATAGDICATFALMPAIKTCQKGDGGTATEAGPTEAGPTEAGPTEAGPTEAGPTDAAGGG
jgi:hypothetical protein